MKEAVIVSGARTPLGAFNGSLGEISATKLGALVIEEAVKRAGIQKTDVNEAIMGMVLPCGYGQNPGKQAVVQAGMPWEVEAITINKVCGSSLKAVMLAAQAIQVGDVDVVVAGGMENMSLAPYYLEKARSGYRMGNGQLVDSPGSLPVDPHGWNWQSRINIKSTMASSSLLCGSLFAR